MGLLVCTRSTGSLLFFVLFVCIVIDYFYNKKRNLLNEIKYILTIYIPATIISCLYPLYLQLKLGNWKYFIDVQYECWSGEKSNFIKNLFREIDIIVNGEFANMDIWVKMQFLSNTIISYILLIIIIILIYFAIKNKEVFKKKELILFLVATLVVCYSVSKKIQAPSTSYYRYFLSCMSLYLLPNNEKIAKYMLNIGFLINLFISTCHCLHTIIF